MTKKRIKYLAIAALLAVGAVSVYASVSYAACGRAPCFMPGFGEREPVQAEVIDPIEAIGRAFRKAREEECIRYPHRRHCIMQRRQGN